VMSGEGGSGGRARGLLKLKAEGESGGLSWRGCGWLMRGCSAGEGAPRSSDDWRELEALAAVAVERVLNESEVRRRRRAESLGSGELGGEKCEGG